MAPFPYKSKQSYLIFLTALLLFVSCKRKKNDIDVSNINVNVKIERFDHDFDQMETKPMAQQSLVLMKKYGLFYQDFIERILDAGNIHDTAYFKTLRQVFAGKPFNDLRQEVYTIYPNLDKQDEELTDAFRHIKYYYPQQKLPAVYAYFSGFQSQTAIGDKYLGIGLDMFLGENSKFYPALIQEYPHYISQRFTPENITPRVIEGIAREEMFPESDADKSLLSRMIYNGKIMYFMDRIIPNVPDSLKIGYTAQQDKWCNDFRSDIWAYFLDQNLLYETDYMKIQVYLSEGPFTPGLGENNESAPKLGVWSGWDIVKQYMGKHPEVTLQQLMADNDAQKILNGAKYHPKANK